MTAEIDTKRQEPKCPCRSWVWDFSSFGKTLKCPIHGDRGMDMKDVQWFPSASATAITAAPALPRKGGRLNLKVPISLHEKLADLAERERVSLNYLVGVLLAEGVERHG